ncbi:hypothetical protein DD898_12390, partial [Staphylococcus pseudintermedius]
MWAIISLILSISLLISIGTNNMLRKKIETLEYILNVVLPLLSPYSFYTLLI